MTQLHKALLTCLLLLGGLWGCNPMASRTTEVANKPPEVASSIKRLRVEPNSQFREVTSQSVSLFLPPGYEGGNPEDDLESVADQLEGAGSEYKNLSEALRESKQVVHFIAFDLKNSSEGFVTSVNVTAPTTLPGTTVETLTQAVVENFKLLNYEVMEQELQLVNDQLMGRIVVQIQAGKEEITQLVYTLAENDRFWIVTYSTPRTEFPKRLSDFEESIPTFQVRAAS